MSIHDRRGLKEAAARSLAHSPDHRQTVLFSVGLAAAAALLVSILSLILDGFIANTGGLSGMALRSTLTTVQALLSLGLSALMPFWGYGLTHAMLKLSRQEAASRSTLLEGFRRFGPVLRLMLLRYLIYCSIAMLAIQFAVGVLSLTPLAAPATQFLLDNAELLTSAAVDEATVLALMDAMMPLMAVSFAVTLGVLAPFFYSFRMADLRIMDDPKCGAIAALVGSARMMRHNRLAVFKLDLSFWWYYLAQGLLTALVNGNLILSMLGVPLPISEDISLLLFLTAGLLGQLALYYFFRAHVEVTYAKAYQSLFPEKPLA